jgi:hypothetical protein
MISVSCSNKQETNNIPISTQPVQELPRVADTLPHRKNEYVVTEEIFWLLSEEQEGHFEKAKEKYDKKELKTSASEIRKAILLIDMEIVTAEESERPKLSIVKNKLIYIYRNVLRKAKRYKLQN